MLLKIHAFAEFCNISVRALHLYDRIGLFSPDKIDENNGYRYYDTDQLTELNTIINFKKIGMSLKDIKEIKMNNYSKDIIISKLKQQEAENIRQIEIAAYNNERILFMLNSIDDFEVHRKDPELEAMHLSKIICLQNNNLEHELYQILWL